MTAHITAYGRLAADPERRETRTGKTWGTARLAVTPPKPYGADDDTDPPTLWLDVTVLGKRGADNLARHRKGDRLSVAGRLERMHPPKAAGVGRPSLSGECVGGGLFWGVSRLMRLDRASAPEPSSREGVR